MRPPRRSARNRLRSTPLQPQVAERAEPISAAPETTKCVHHQPGRGVGSSYPARGATRRSNPERDELPRRSDLEPRETGEHSSQSVVGARTHTDEYAASATRLAPSGSVAQYRVLSSSSGARPHGAVALQLITSSTTASSVALDRPGLYVRILRYLIASVIECRARGRARLGL